MVLDTFASLDAIDRLLQSQWHEARLCALIIPALQSRKSVTKKTLDFYLAHTSRINNGDLVDLSAPAIVGMYLRQNAQERT